MDIYEPDKEQFCNRITSFPFLQQKLYDNLSNNMLQ